jgi:hypothetical protein
MQGKKQHQTKPAGKKNNVVSVLSIFVVGGGIASVAWRLQYRLGRLLLSATRMPTCSVY